MVNVGTGILVLCSTTVSGITALIDCYNYTAIKMRDILYQKIYFCAWPYCLLYANKTKLIDIFHKRDSLFDPYPLKISPEVDTFLNHPKTFF